MRKESSNGKLFFNLRAANHQVIGTSELYNSAAAGRRPGIATVLLLGPKRVRLSDARPSRALPTRPYYARGVLRALEDDLSTVKAAIGRIGATRELRTLCTDGHLL